MPKNRFFLFFLILLVLCTFCFASDMLDAKSMISDTIKEAVSYGAADTTNDFVLRTGELVDVQDLSSKTGLDVNSIFFVMGQYQSTDGLDIGDGTYVKYTGPTRRRMSAEVFCEQTPVALDFSLAELNKTSRVRDYDIGSGSSNHCESVQPCCAIVLALPRGTSTSSYVSDSNNEFISFLISIIIIVGIPLLLLALVFVYRKKPSSLFCLTCVYSLPTFYMAQIVLYGLLFFFLGALRGFFDWGYFSSWVIIFDLAFFSSLTVLLLAFFVFKSKNMPIEKKLFWLKIFAVLAFFINLFMLFFLSISMLSD